MRRLLAVLLVFLLLPSAALALPLDLDERPEKNRDRVGLHLGALLQGTSGAFAPGFRSIDRAAALRGVLPGFRGGVTQRPVHPFLGSPLVPPGAQQSAFSFICATSIGFSDLSPELCSQDPPPVEEQVFSSPLVPLVSSRQPFGGATLTASGLGDSEGGSSPVTPEPGTALLLAGGLAGLAVAGRRPRTA